MAPSGTIPVAPHSQVKANQRAQVVLGAELPVVDVGRIGLGHRVLRVHALLSGSVLTSTPASTNWSTKYCGFAAIWRASNVA